MTTTLETRLADCLKAATNDLAVMLMEGVVQNMKPFFDKVSKESGMSVARLEELFNETQQGLELPEKPAPRKAATRKPSGKKAPAGPVVECDFIMTARSAKAGQPCGAKVTQDGVTRCRRHLKSKTDDEKKPAAKGKAAAKNTGGGGSTASKSKAKKTVDPPVIKDAVETAEPVVEEEETLQVNEWGHYMDPENKFVFADPSTVCGRQNMESGKIEPLTDAEKEVCGLNEWEYNVDAEPAKPGDDAEDSE